MWFMTRGIVETIVFLGELRQNNQIFRKCVRDLWFTPQIMIPLKIFLNLSLYYHKFFLSNSIKFTQNAIYSKNIDDKTRSKYFRSSKIILSTCFVNFHCYCKFRACFSINDESLIVRWTRIYHRLAKPWKSRECRYESPH